MSEIFGKTAKYRCHSIFHRSAVPSLPKHLKSGVNAHPVFTPPNRLVFHPSPSPRFSPRKRPRRDDHFAACSGGRKRHRCPAKGGRSHPSQIGHIESDRSVLRHVRNAEEIGRSTR